MPTLMLPILTFLKKYWVYVALALLVFTNFAAIKSCANNSTLASGFLKTIQTMETAQKIEIDKINAAYTAERVAHEANLAKLQNDLQTVQTQYDQAKNDLSQERN
jgi:hypothetical protein